MARPHAKESYQALKESFQATKLQWHTLQFDWLGAKVNDQNSALVKSSYTIGPPPLHMSYETHLHGWGGLKNLQDSPLISLYPNAFFP